MDYIIIVAGGKGLRMGSDIPKQFLPVDGLPVLMRTIRRFREYSADINIILVLPKSQQDYWQSLCKEYGFDEIVAFGDNLNDLPMFEQADIKIAVGNARDEVKAAADIVIGTNDNDGVAQWLCDELKVES